VSTYKSKLEAYQKNTTLKDAVVTGLCKIGEHRVALGVMDFSFLGGSMGSVVGEKLTRLIERATEKEMPVIIISTSGGARMYEGMFSLMQMAKTSAALAYHAQRRLPYISVLTHPTTAGVMASYASLGDLILAEPGAMIGFAGPRVIKDTTQAELPPGFQTAEFLLDHGLIDAIVPRKEMKERLIEYLDFLTAGKRPPPRPEHLHRRPSYHKCAFSRLPSARPFENHAHQIAEGVPAGCKAASCARRSRADAGVK
jgi:acetyl-CoA carboxylase carboxyl transferase subunit beta